MGRGRGSGRGKKGKEKQQFDGANKERAKELYTATNRDLSKDRPCPRQLANSKRVLTMVKLWYIINYLFNFYGEGSITGFLAWNLCCLQKTETCIKNIYDS